MKRMKAFDFDVVVLAGPPRFTCRFITKTNDSITLYGNSVEEIFQQCRSQFPEGLHTRGIVFSGFDNLDAKKNLSEFLSLGFRDGYFQAPQERTDNEDLNESF